MAEYIEREATCSGCIHNGVCYMQEICNDIDKQLREFGCDDYKSAADVVEVRHGIWRQNPNVKRIYFCSECGRRIEDGSNKPTEFFPYCHCGAKMDGGKE